MQTRVPIPTASGDPNSTAEHFDVIKEQLKAKATDTTVSDAEREQARQMLRDFYPETAPSDPNARKTIWDRAKESGI
jgi:hypothetical protein